MKKIQIILIIHNIRSTHNVGSLMRSADGFGVKHIYLTGYTPYPKKENDQRLPHIYEKMTKQINKTALGAENNIHHISSYDKFMYMLAWVDK
jgi:23S rRNA (guanosine2251-2'-O)-methyltransferase